MHASILLTLALFAASLVGASAQIIYGRPEVNGVQTLRAINADGTGDTAFNLPFPKVYLPSWSRDGALLSVTAVDPARPALVSLNAWVVDAASGARTQITHFQDNAGGGYSIAFAFYKAFSPDNRQLAVNSYIRQDDPNTGFTQTVPILQLYPTNGDPGPTATLHVGNKRDEVHHEGEGVDWSPQNVIAAPFKWDAPLQSGLDATYGKGEATAIFLVDPNNGNTRQLTVPHADVVFSGGAVAGTYAEEDYAPKFSPNGAQLAYVRSFQFAGGSGPDRDVQSLRIIDLNSGADREVIHFQKGLYVTSVDWSPDGTQLVFDLGQQAASSGYPIQFVDPNTNAVYLIGADGNNVHQVVGPPSGTPAWRPNVPPAALGNISTRLRVGTGEQQLIGGFIITGNAPKKVLVRALGPSLGASGVQGALDNPFLELHAGDAVVASNDDWQQAPNTNEIPNGFAPSDGRESVVIATLDPGSYTALVRGAQGQTGVGLIEAYDLSGSSASKLANISTRGAVTSGDNVLIGGFIAVGSGGNTKVVLRALGPSLGKAGVSDALADTTLELIDANGTSVRQNDNWQDAQAGEIQASGIAPGDPAESAIVASLAPGSYTAIVRGKNNANGIGLVEVYNVQ